MKQIIAFISCLFVITAAKAQADTSIERNSPEPSILSGKEQRFFINVHAGYATALGSTFKFYPDDVSSVAVEKVNNNPATTQTQYRSSSKGLGEGFRYGLGLSYIVNDFINVGIEFDYFRSTISKTRDSSYHAITNSDNGTVDYTYHQRDVISYDATLLTFSPNITFKAISRPKFYIYNKVGAVLTFRPNSIQKNIVQENSSTTNGNTSFDSSANSYTRYEWGIKKPALGFSGSVGAQVKLSERLRAFAEIQFSHVVFAVKNRVLTDYVVNGSDLTGTIPENEKIIDFRNQYSDNGQGTNPNQPTVSVVQRIPITYLGLQAGIAFRF